jgi:hypothetical protein
MSKMNINAKPFVSDDEEWFNKVVKDFRNKNNWIFNGKTGVIGEELKQNTRVHEHRKLGKL